MNQLAKTLAIGLFLTALLFATGALHCGCATLTEADRLTIAHDAVRIEVCKQKGRDCKADRDGGPGCFDVYSECMQDAGLR